MDDRLKKQMDFILELDKVKRITRQTYLTGGEKKENDAEHSWHLAVMALLLKEYSNEDVDLLHVMSMVLIHDVIEIDAGDTYAYDEKGNTTKRDREVKAAKRIFGILPEDQEKMMWELWEEFEAYDTPESKFANMLDRLQPLMLNDATDGKAWLEHDVAKHQILNRNVRVHEGSEQMWSLMQNIIDKNVSLGHIKNE